MGETYVIAANTLSGDKLVAAAVIYPVAAPEPHFSYVVRGKARTAPLYHIEGRLPLKYHLPMCTYIRAAVPGWAVVAVAPDTPPDRAITLAVIRAIERWACRLDAHPPLREVAVHIPLRRHLTEIPEKMVQRVDVKDWRTFSAKALCRDHLNRSAWASICL